MIRYVAALLLFLCLGGSALADGVRLSLLDAGYGRSRTQILLGIKVELEDGWHGYWLSPGETGLPPSLAAVGGDNAGKAEFLWPLPERFEVSGYETVGYRSSLVVPLTVPVHDSSRAVTVRVTGTFFACRDVCAPFPVDLTAETTPGHRNASALSEIAPWLLRTPSKKPGAVDVLTTKVEGDRLSVRFASPKMTRPEAFVDLGTRAFASLSSLTVEGDVATAEFAITNARGRHVDLDGATIVVSDGTETFQTAIVAPVTPSMPVLWIALVAGFILNVMPCVFPVIAIKVFSLSSAPSSRRRQSYAATAVGIVCAFLCMAGAVALLKAAGHQASWGMQFQQPVFIMAMTIVTGFFAVNMAGAFEVVLPSVVSTRLHRVTRGEGAASAFGQGFVLTLLATPCSAPFVGTAVGYALSGGTFGLVSVFVAMGLGMAIPYLVLASVPGTTRLLPKPGQWMVTVKYILAAMMAISSGWLASLALLGSNGRWLTLAAATSAALAVTSFMIVRGVPRCVAAACLAGFLLIPVSNALPTAATYDPGIAWRQFDASDADDLARQGKIVFIDISADWCLTCKINERGGLASIEVREILGEPDVVAMKGDWTRPDERIASFLKKHGRYGIPFYLVVGPSAPQGIVLSEILSVDQLRRAVARARDTRRS